MPATAGRVRMPANNRVHSSAALQTHGIWQSAIGYDPYAPDQKQAPPTAAGGDRDAQALSAPSADQQNAYDSFQGLLALARLTGSNADEARGACRKCGRVGHLPFQCRNFLVLKDEATLAAANAAVAIGNYPDGAGSLHRKDRSHGKRNREDTSGQVASDLSSEEIESSEIDESGLSDSSEDSDMERAIAAKFGKNVVNSLSRKGKSTHGKEQTRRKKSRSKRSKGERQVSSEDDSSASSKEDSKKSRHRSKSKRSHKTMADSVSDEEGSDSESEEERRKRKRRQGHSHKHSKSRRKHRSKHADESSGGGRTKRSRKKSSSRRQADEKHGSHVRL